MALLLVVTLVPGAHADDGGGMPPSAETFGGEGLDTETLATTLQAEPPAASQGVDGTGDPEAGAEGLPQPWVPLEVTERRAEGQESGSQQREVDTGGSEGPSGQRTREQDQSGQGGEGGQPQRDVTAVLRLSLEVVPGVQGNAASPGAADLTLGLPVAAGGAQTHPQPEHGRPGDDDVEAPGELVVAAPTDSGDRQGRGRPPGRSRPPAAEQQPPNPSAPLPQRVRAAGQAVQGPGAYSLEFLRAWHEETRKLRREVAGSPDASTVNALYQRVWRRLGPLEAAVAAAQQPPDPTAPLDERVRAAGQAVQGMGPYSPEILRAWHEETGKLRLRVAGSPDATIVNALYQRVLRRLGRPEDVVAAVQQPPDPTAPLDERVRAADRAVRGMGAYSLEILRAWHEETRKLRREVVERSPDAATVKSAYGRVLRRLRRSDASASGGAGGSASPMSIVTLTPGPPPQQSLAGEQVVPGTSGHPSPDDEDRELVTGTVGFPSPDDEDRELVTGTVGRTVTPAQAVGTGRLAAVSAELAPAGVVGVSLAVILSVLRTLGCRGACPAAVLGPAVPGFQGVPGKLQG